MQTVGSVASIVASIREDAAAEVERIDQSIVAETAAIRTEEQTANVSIGDREPRLAAARRANSERLAQQEWEGRLAVIEQREAWIARVVAKAREEWRSNPQQLTALIREALANVDAPVIEVTVAARDRAFVNQAKFDKTIQIRTGDIDGGCIVAAGEIVFDNSFDARARRLEAEWRKALSEVYQR